MILMNAKLALLFNLCSLCLIGCGPSGEEITLKEENARLANENADLRKRLEEKERYIKLAQENPDKRDLDEIEKDFRTTTDVKSLIPRYEMFQRKYPESPLVANARKRVTEIQRKLEDERESQQRSDEFSRTPVVELEELCAYPEKYLRQTSPILEIFWLIPATTH